MARYRSIPLDALTRAEFEQLEERVETAALDEHLDAVYGEEEDG